MCGQDEEERGKKRTVGDRAEEEKRCDGRRRWTEERERKGRERRGGRRCLMRAVWQFCRGH